MPKQDFLMRMIEQLRGLLPYILDMARTGNYREAHAVIDQAVRELVGIGTEGLVNLPDEVILDRVQADSAVAWQDKCLFLAAVLTEEADMLRAQEEEEAAYGRYVKALNLLLMLAHTGDEIDVAGELAPDVDRLVTALADYHVPASTCVYLLQYYEQQGDFTAVENVLFDWLENAPAALRTGSADPGLVGLEMLVRLREKPAADLEAGGLNHDEVEAAIADLQALGYEA